MMSTDYFTTSYQKLFLLNIYLQIEKLKTFFFTLKFCFLLNHRLSSKTSHPLCKNALVEVQTETLGTHLLLISLVIPEKWSIKMHFFAYAHITQSIFNLRVSPYQIVIRTQRRIALNCRLKTLNYFRDRAPHYIFDLPSHSCCQANDLILVFHGIMMKSFSN